MVGHRGGQKQNLMILWFMLLAQRILLFVGASAYTYQDVGPSAYAYASASAAAADSVCGYASGSDFVAIYDSASDHGQSEVMGRVMVKVMVKFVALSTPRTKVIIQHPIQTACSHCKSFEDLIS